MQTLLAWLRRKPGQTPLTSSKRSIIRACVRRCGESQPPTKAKHPTTIKTAIPITANLIRTPFSRSAESRYGVAEFGSGTAPSVLDRSQPRSRRRTPRPVFRSVEPSCYALLRKTREETMIHHLSIAARDPKHVAGVLAEFMGGVAVPFPPNPGSFFALQRDEHGSGVEVYPAGTELQPGGSDGAGFAK